MSRAWLAGCAALGILLADQLTKAWALQALVLGQTSPIIPGLFHLTLVLNPGVAFGLLGGVGWPITVIALALIVGLLLTTWRQEQPVAARPAWVTPLALGLIVGGAVGNLIDRLRVGRVIDFLDFRVWPVFNVADSAITVGAVMLALAWWRSR